MISVNSLVTARHELPNSIEVADPDPLREIDTLQEAQLLDSECVS